MSNYLIAVYAPSEELKIAAWLEKHSVESEVYRVKLGSQRTLLIVSKGVEASVSKQQYFRGVALAPDHSGVFFGIDGWLEASAKVRGSIHDHEGEYLAVRWIHNRVEVARDVFGNGRLVTTSCAGLAAASDSLLLLASLRRAVGATLSVDTVSMLARAVPNNRAGQQISPATLFREIRFVPAGQGLALRRNFSWKLVGAQMSSRVHQATESYAKEVRLVATQLAQTMLAAGSISGQTSTINLSGGLDSRVLFAAARAAGTLKLFDYFSANSSAAHTRDFEIATALASGFGMPPAPESSSSAGGPQLFTLAQWSASLAGIYDGFGPAQTEREERKGLELTGIGAETAKGGWGWRSWPATVNDIRGDAAVKAAFASSGAEGIRALGASPDRPDASELYYAGYRNGLHSSAGHISLHMTGLHPLQNMRLTRVGHMGKNRRTGKGPDGTPSIISDLSILLDPAVAAFEYADSARAITTKQTEERLSALGGRIQVQDVSPFQRLGSFNAIPRGSTALALSVAKELDLAGDLTASSLFADAESDIARIPDLAVRDVYKSVEAHARWRLSKAEGNVRAAGASPPKIAALGLLRVLS